jgi:hypothetical protein
LADLLIKLYELPTFDSIYTEMPDSPLVVRPARAYEKKAVVDFVRHGFGDGWASECDVAFANRPISCHIATERGDISGFACYDSTARGFFGPIGVEAGARGRGIGRLLLLSCLRTMATLGYGYAVVGYAGCREFYVNTVGAVEIPGSAPGVYRDRLKPRDDEKQ